MRVVVVGATGTIGRPLVRALSVEHDVVGVARTPPKTTDDEVEWLAADATDTAAMRRALDGAEVVYHLVHSLGSDDFETLDRAAATAVVAGAAAGGARQIVYLGGLGEGADDLSPHLRSRAETAAILKAGPVPVTTLRAAMIVGAGSAAFETILALVERLPVMICPRWVSVATQPIAVADVLAVLVGVCGNEAAYGQTFDLGGPEVMTYRTMMERVARLRGKRPILIEVPLLTPWLSSLWLHLVTPASVAVARPLVEGLRVPTIAQRRSDLGPRRSATDELRRGDPLRARRARLTGEQNRSLGELEEADLEHPASEGKTRLPRGVAVHGRRQRLVEASSSRRARGSIAPWSHRAPRRRAARSRAGASGSPHASRLRRSACPA